MEKLNLHQKLVDIRKNIGGFTKDTQGYGYKYVSGTQVLAKIQEKMNELGVLLIPQIKTQEFEKHEYVNKKGNVALDFLVYGQMTYTWVNADNPEDKLEVPFYYTGAQDDISKAFGSGLTYSERYFVIKFFNLPTDADDPDNRDTGNREFSKNGNYNNNSQPKSNSSYTSKIKMPTTAQEAAAIEIGFGKHKGKTLKQLWTEDNQYILWLLGSEKTDPSIREGIELMQVAAAQAEIKKKMQ